MAIKTQLVEGQRRIITKVVNGQRRVSCSCCEGEPFCCMYPADELGNLYGADDLPDAVTVNWTDRFTGSMSKSGSGYAGGGATLQVVNGIWRLSDSDGTRNVGRCLIRGDGNLTQGDDLVEDQFADSYQVAGDGGAVTVTRISLCRWEGFGNQGIASLTFRNTDDDGAPAQKWSASIETGSGQQDGEKSNQSSPVGTYDQNMSAPQLSPIVVSEP
jgi:hypothetical protein